MHLGEEARRAVAEILHPGETLVSVSTWADLIKFDPRWKNTRRWHAVFLPTGAKGYVAARDCPKGRCIVGVIEKFMAVFPDRTRTQAERRRALMFLVHLVADIHQPLHAGRREDGGGGSIRVRFFEGNMNLHQLWDRALIERTGLSEAEIAERAFRAVSVSTPQGQPSVWANESHRLALSRAYTAREGSELGEEYWEKSFPVALRRLGEAGLRLARILTSSLAQAF